MRLPLIQALFCANLIFASSYAGVVNSDGRPGQILGKDARKRYQHDDLELGLKQQNLSSSSQEMNEEREEDSGRMLADMASADALAEGGDESEEREVEVTGRINGLQIDSFLIESKIVSRFATTIVSSRVKNYNNEAAEVSFTVVLPEEAFIANFTMLINNETVVGNVKEKKEAKATYEAARAAGQTAGHVEQTPRRTNAFKISVNIGGQEKVEFQLTYQEVLTRVNDYYKHVINIRPGQIVKRMKLTLDVREDAMINKFHIPKIAKDIGDQTIHQLIKMDDWSNELKIAKNFTKQASQLFASYSPTDKQQREFSDTGLNGQFVFLYDVERPAGGEIKAVNGYFVHFFAPEIADALPKHILFVIDQSGSMEGTKMRQTKEAMDVILKDLSPTDYFNILSFEGTTSYWKENAQQVNPDSIANAQSFVKDIRALGGTNINAALLTALDMLNTNSSVNFERYQPVIIFLTDGEATVGVTQSDHILTNIAEKQRPNNLVAIHSISFGAGADFELLKKISARNGGLARKIYEDSDAAIQLHGFYSEISHPLLTNVKINYLNETVEPDSIVASNSKVYYKGGEVMIVGKLQDSFMEQRPSSQGNDNRAMKLMAVDIQGLGNGADREFRTECIIFPYPWPTPLPIGVRTLAAEPLPADSLGGFVERMWAYKTIKQLLKDAESRVDTEAKKKELRDKALALSLKYNFVTELTSMVVVQDDKEIEPRFVEEKESEADSFRSASLAYSMAHAPRLHSSGTWFSRSGGFLNGASGSGQIYNVNSASMSVGFDSYSGMPAPQSHQALRANSHTADSVEEDADADDAVPADSKTLPTFSTSEVPSEEETTDDMDEPVTMTETTICRGANHITVDCNHPLVCNVPSCESVGMSVDRNATCQIMEDCQKTNRTMCVCNFGYVMLNGECVEPRSCPQYNCSENESLMTGCFADCEGACGQPLPAYAQCEITCKAAKCVCKRGFVRNAEGKCVSQTQCEHAPNTCSDPNAELNACGQQCTQRTCEEVQEVISKLKSSENSTLAAASISLPVECNTTCLGPPKCVCRQGFFLLNKIDGQPTCVEIGHCPSHQCGSNETLNPCGNACDKKCSQRGQPQPCSKMCDVPACWCKPGFFRNDNNECVAEDDCEPTSEFDSFFFF